MARPAVHLSPAAVAELRRFAKHGTRRHLVAGAPTTPSVRDLAARLASLRLTPKKLSPGVIARLQAPRDRAGYPVGELMALRNGATRHQSPRAAVPTSICQIVPVPGVCVVCGCTDNRACEGGCSWIDPGCLCCSRCVLRLGLVVMHALTALGGDLTTPAAPAKRPRPKGKGKT